MERADLAELLGGRAGDASRTWINTEDPAEFMTQFAGAVAGAGEIFLGNPRWGGIERGQAEELLAASPPGRPARGWLMVPTGGTSGRVRFARHDSHTVGAAVRGFTRHFGLDRVNAVGLLPLGHVSGLMAWLRCALTGGAYHPADWKEVAAGRWPERAARPDGWVLSLVPTQLERLLRARAAVEWLQGFRIIFLGGAAAWPELLERAAAARLQLSPGYGLTETAAMCAALRPEEFLAGGRSCGRALPHVRLAVDAKGVVGVGGDAVFRGYYPDWRKEGSFRTGDLGTLDEAGCLTVLGRHDSLIITGGEKVHPPEVEAALRASGEFTDVAVLGWPHPEWGQQVVAVFPADRAPNLARVNAHLGRQLAPAKRPKLFVPLPSWPRDPQGKLRRAALEPLVAAQLQSGGPRRDA